MEIKKSKSANIEKSKPLFLKIAFILAILIVLFAFNINFKSESSDSFKNSYSDKTEEVKIPITRRKEEPKNKVTKIIIPEIKIVEKITNTDTTDIVGLLSTLDTAAIIDLPVVEKIDTITFVAVEKMPEFPGGIKALHAYINKKIKYPRKAKEYEITGTVYLRFVVTKTGKVGKVEILKGCDELLEKEAVRVMKLLPNFIPGSQNGKNVDVWLSMPIKFNLD